MKTKMLILLLLTMVCTFNIRAESGWEKAGLKGKIKEVIYTLIYADGGKIVYKTSYDKSGNKIEEVFYNTKGEIMITRYKFYELGNSVEEAFYTAEGNPYKRFYDLTKYKYQYDKNGNVIVEEGFTIDGKQIKEASYKNKYKYDENGKKIKVERQSWNGIIYKYVYDEMGNMLEMAGAYDLDGYPAEEYGFIKKIYKYDEMGNQVEERQSSGTSEPILISTTTYQYDENKNIISARKFNNTRTLIKKYTYSYDKIGNKVERMDLNIVTGATKKTLEVPYTYETWSYVYY